MVPCSLPTGYIFHNTDYMINLFAWGASTLGDRQNARYIKRSFYSTIRFR